MTLIKHPTDYSFPSGHACASFVCAYMAHRRFENRGIRAAFWALASLITVSRIYVGVHYPTDLAVAIFIAVFGSMLVYKLNRKFIPESFLAA